MDMHINDLLHGSSCCYLLYSNEGELARAEMR